MKVRAICLAMLTLAAAGQASESPPLPKALKTAPPNTWVEVVKGEKNGRRLAPVFFYAPALKRFVRAAGGGPGIPFWNEDANKYDRYDTEELDLAAGRWLNAYPPGTRKGRPESEAVAGSSLKPYKRARAWQRRTWTGLDGTQVRIKNWPVFHQWTYVPERKTLYVTTGGGGMLTYDTAKRTWAELKCKTKNYRGGSRWCSLAYDPVNREIVQVGGHGGQPGTWIFDLPTTEWRKLDCGSAAMKKLGGKAADLRWRAITLLGASANRFTVAETDEEAKVDLAARARSLNAALKKLDAESRAAKVDANEKAGVARAAGLLADLAARYGSAAAKLGGKLEAATLSELRSLKFKTDQVCDSLAAEPPPRGLSPAVYDPEHRKVVVFGGEQLDRTLSDTWLYDCKTRRWEQRFPKKVPCPRAGQLMAWLPEAKRIFLAGGYTRHRLAQDKWVYDVDRNEWSFINLVPLKDFKYFEPDPGSPGTPNPSMNGWPLVGAVIPGDIVVSAGPQYSGAMACRVDASKIDPAGTGKNGVASGSYTLHPLNPAKWEKLAKPDPKANLKFLKELPANKWHAFKFPAYAPGGTNRWGTAAYDTDRHQFLLWTGGHASSWENEVDHFSVRGSVWTISYPPDAPINPTATLSTWAGYGGVRTFFDRVTPGHSYHFVAYDPSGKYFYRSAVYDVRAREWRKPYPGFLGKGEFLVSTPHGVVSLSSTGNCRFDAKTERWQKLPWKGPFVRKFYCDTFTAAYDSKRDCLWTFDNQVVLRYDFKTGEARQMKTGAKPKGGGGWFLCRESVCIPDADLVLSPVKVKAKSGWTSGWAAWDLIEHKYLAVDLPRDDRGKAVPFGRLDTPHAGLAYDPELRVVLLNDMRRRSVWVLRFDRKTAKIEEAQ